MRRGQRALLATDQIQIAAVHEQTCPLAQHEHRVETIDRVDEQREPAADGEEPERVRDDALLLALGRDPLHEKAHREERLAEEAHRQPEMLSAHRSSLSVDRLRGLVRRAGSACYNATVSPYRTRNPSRKDFGVPMSFPSRHPAYWCA